MALFVEYTTVTDIHTMTGSPGTGQDPYYLDLIRSTSRELDNVANRRFVPQVMTELYNTPRDGVTFPSGSGVWAAAGQKLIFDDDLLEVTTLTNGDGSVISSTNYLLYPANAYPKYKLQLKTTATVGFLPDANGNYDQAIGVLGVWGWHNDYGYAWSVVDTLNAAIVSTTATTLTTVGHTTVRAGDLLKIDSELLYAVSVSGTGPDTVTVSRGANGSTAATHLISANVTRWYQPHIEAIVRTAVVAYVRLKDNPAGDAVDVGGYRFMTPKDVTKWIDQRCRSLGIVKQAIA